jgi:hypothetical protein
VFTRPCSRASAPSPRPHNAADYSPIGSRLAGSARGFEQSPLYRPAARMQPIATPRRAMMLTSIQRTKSKRRVASLARRNAFSRARRSARSSAKVRSSRKGWAESIVVSYEGTQTTPSQRTQLGQNAGRSSLQGRYGNVVDRGVAQQSFRRAPSSIPRTRRGHLSARR